MVAGRCFQLFMTCCENNFALTNATADFLDSFCSAIGSSKSYV